MTRCEMVAALKWFLMRQCSDDDVANQIKVCRNQSVRGVGC